MSEDTGEKDTSWEVQWKAPDKAVWSLSWATKTKEKALEYMKLDVAYFYDDIEIRLVEVTKVPVEIVKGSNPRGSKRSCIA